MKKIEETDTYPSLYKAYVYPKHEKLKSCKDGTNTGEIQTSPHNVKVISNAYNPKNQ